MTRALVGWKSDAQIYMYSTGPIYRSYETALASHRIRTQQLSYLERTIPSAADSKPDQETYSTAGSEGVHIPRTIDVQSGL